MKKVGIDIDFTITEMPEFFALLTASLLKNGSEVHVISYREDEKETIQELKQLNIKYTQLHLPRGDQEMVSWKSNLAAELDLDLMIEDSPEVLAAMPLKTKRLWLCDPEVFDLDLCISAMRARK